MHGQLQRNLGHNLRAQRARLGMTHVEFARVLGVSPGHASSPERGEGDVSLLELDRFADELEVDPVALLVCAPLPVRESTTTTVLRMLAEYPGLSRTELCENIPLASTTVRRAVRDLLEAGLLVEDPPSGRRHKSGRRPRSLRISEPQHRFAHLAPEGLGNPVSV